MITFDQAITADRFEHTVATNADKTPLRAKRNGKTQTWKTRPGHFRIPVKRGLHQYGTITHETSHFWTVKS